MAVIQRVGSPAKPRKWMSVHEMGDMLGLKKTDRYWLVHKNYFRTETLLGKMRVEIASFEKWYANQDWYHKVNGEAPGKELRLRFYSPKEIQEMLGTDNATVYEILKKNNIETIGIAWLRYRRKITNIVSYITVKIQMESGNRSGKRMIQRTQLKSEKQKLN